MSDRAVDERAIGRVLALYCRAVDRCDGSLLSGCFWPDAHVDYGGYQGSFDAFGPRLIDALRNWRQTHHQLGQSLFDWLSSDRAGVETYVTAGHLPMTADDDEMTYLGRYLDVFERRGGEWRIAGRRIVMSWTRLAPPTHDGGHRAVAGLAVAARAPDDPLYRSD